MAASATGRMGRRRFLGSAITLGVPATILGSPGGGFGVGLRDRRSLPLREGGVPALRAYGDFPQHAAGRVRGVVGASHGDFERVRELVTEQPALAKASWDWGFGDWETALGAAAHTGRREIAELLIAHGARPTIFSAAMMGEVDTVRAYLAADPSLYELDGPHGIPLMVHARAGREGAQRVVDFLLDRFGPDERSWAFEGDDDIDALYGGRYAFDHTPPFEIVVGVRNGFLLVGAGESPISRMGRHEEHVFHPSGAPAVRLEFDVRDGRARALTIVDGPTRVTGARIG